MLRLLPLGLTAAMATAPGCVSPPSRPAPGASATPVHPHLAGQTTLRVGGLSCPLCAHNAELALGKVPGVRSSKTDLSTGWVTLSLDPAAPPTAQQIEDAVLDAGFSVAVPAAPAEAPARGAATPNPGDPIIKSQSVSVELAASIPPADADAVAAQLMKLPDVASVQVAKDGTRVGLFFTPEACLTQGQVRRALERVGHRAQRFTTPVKGGR